MPKHVWKDLADLGGDRRRADEFAPEVALALAQLRAAHGESNVSCQSEGNRPGSIPEVAAMGAAVDPALVADADRFRDELSIALPGVNRRGFLQLTGAAAVFALAGCWHKKPDTLVPYANQPEGTTVGKPVWWSSVLRDAGRAVPVMVKTYDGRPIKLEGNPDSPINNGAVVSGALDLRTQAALLNLYDPDRRQIGPLKKSGGQPAALSWDQLDAELGAALTSGAVALISGAFDSPSRKQLLDELATAFGDRFVHAAYDAYAPDAEVRARELSFGPAAAKPAVLHIDRADVVVTLGSDLLGGGQTGLSEQIGYGDLRRRRLDADGKAVIGQVICFEPTLTQTGTVCDVRVRAGMDQLAAIAWGIAKALGATLPDGAIAKTGKELGLKDVGGVDAVAFAAQRLAIAREAGRNSLIYVGGAQHCGDNSIALHVAANFLNRFLGNEGVTIETASVPASAIAPSHAATRAALAKAAGATLILWGANPAHSLPGASEAIAKAKTVVVIAERADESFAAATAAYLAPSLHGLESWGDAELVSGLFALQQPCIQPLWD
nr:hypothetical protein [Planctomycetota bacterium]